MTPIVSGQRGIIDTVLAPAFLNECALEPALFGTDLGGFVTGTNGYLDIAKLQRIEFEDTYDFHVEAVRASMVLDSSGLAGALDDIMIVGKIYAENTNGSVGDFLGDSDSVRIGDLAFTDSTITLVDFPFSTPVPFTETGSIFVGVNFADVYSLPTGDIGIISTDENCGDGSNAFDVFQDSLGNDVFLAFSEGWGLELEMYMSVVIDREPPVATRNPVADYAAKVSPNPAFEQINITFNAPGNDQMVATLLSTSGQKLREQAVNTSVGLHTVQWNVAELPAGVYLYQIAGPAGIETGRVIVK